MKKINVAILSKNKLTPAVEHKPQRIRTKIKCSGSIKTLDRFNEIMAELKNRYSAVQTK
jgi:hypothetical protein